MDDMSEQQKAIAWLWVVEGVATMKQVGVSVLWGTSIFTSISISRYLSLLFHLNSVSEDQDFVVFSDLLGQIGSAIPDHMSKNARERIALRCLEELFGSSSDYRMSTDVPSSQNSKISFDLSESCESVLKHIIDEVKF